MDKESALIWAREYVIYLYRLDSTSRFPHKTGEIREMMSQILAVAEFLTGKAE